MSTRPTISANQLTFGTDPEVAATYVKDDITYVQPAPYFRHECGAQAEKANSKHPIHFKSYGIEIIEDGVAFEFTVPPTRDCSDMYDNIQFALGNLQRILGNYDHYLTIQPTMNYEIERFLHVDDDYKMCLIFGCDPDKDAILPHYVCEVIDALQHPYRYFGGHFQIGCLDPRGRRLIQTHYEPFIKLCAIFIGNSVMARSGHTKLEKVRAKLYGQPGRYRIQPWGIEYRTPSNSWITSRATMAKMFRGAEHAFRLLQNPKVGKQVINDFLPDTITALANADGELSQQILEDVRSDYEF
jgi:hypothetical protein